MSNVINLKQARKSKARKEKASKAADNRIEFGRTKAEKEISKTEKKRQTKILDDHKLDK
ncbi:DUF4169 family protein [Kiloniella litopenaei]|uniref:DUF4169 family protein n=1 Tax=Kiloniella litopenaei TaxID=1549748 RepID=UPI0009E4380A|nr:DUF4169 family protein [Kiloniella litopenaei]